MILETQRLTLRRQVAADVDALDALYRDPEVRRYIHDAPTTRAETVEEIEWFTAGHPEHPELGLWATIDKASGRFIGRCGLLPWRIEDRDEVEVAYLLKRECWGQGLATEVASAIRDYAFEALGISRLIVLVDPANGASIRVAQKIGMHLEQELDGVAGNGMPTLLLAMVKTS